jgi:arginine repressor
MAATYLEKQEVGTASEFKSRVKMAIIRHSIFRINENTIPGEVSLAKTVLDNPDHHAAMMALAITTEPGAANAIDTAIDNEASPKIGADISDALIEAAVQVVFPAFVRP